MPTDASGRVSDVTSWNGATVSVIVLTPKLTPPESCTRSVNGKTPSATGEHASELIEHIYDLLGKRIGAGAARNIRVLYGGTVNQKNVSEYAKFANIDGALVGAASLDSENFWQIVKEFNREAIHRT